MKIRRLPDTETANYAGRPEEELRILLRHHDVSFAPYSYWPSRKHDRDAFDVQGPLLPARSVSRETLLANVAKDCKRGDDETRANTAVSAAIFDLVNESRLSSRAREFPRQLEVGPNAGIGGWRPWTVHGADSLFVPFVDYRKKNGLTADGMRFVFSAMHHSFRTLDLDYADVKLCVIKMPESKGARTPELIFDSGIELYSFEEMSDMVSRLYRVWADVLFDREREVRTRRTGSGGGLL